MPPHLQAAAAHPPLFLPVLPQSLVLPPSMMQPLPCENPELMNTVASSVLPKRGKTKATPRINNNIAATDITPPDPNSFMMLMAGAEQSSDVHLKFDQYIK